MEKYPHFGDTPDVPMFERIETEYGGKKAKERRETTDGEITQEQAERWREVLRQMPVSINNYYGDPTIQWPNTIEKCDDLIATRHAGPVGLITKGKITAQHAAELKEKKEQGLNIVCMISISELPKLEGVGGPHRYENIRHLTEQGIPAIAYVRPMMPPHNTSEEVIEKMFKNISEAGGKVAVASGFRGDESLVDKLAPDEKVEWALRVKVMPGEIYERIKRIAEKYGVKLFTRTACAVAYATGEERTFNPYYNSPNLVKCSELACPLQETCGPLPEPREGSLELVRALGYDIEFNEGARGQKCGVSGEDRLKCPSCCTTCYFAKNIPHITVKGDVSLGDLSFIRFATGVMAMQPGRNDDGSKDVGRARFANYPEIDNVDVLNTWVPMAHNVDKCFGCKYCIVGEYYNEGLSRKEVGMAPARLVDKMIEKQEKNNDIYGTRK